MLKFHTLQQCLGLLDLLLDLSETLLVLNSAEHAVLKRAHFHVLSPELRMSTYVNRIVLAWISSL